eukprot:SAG31_NODE_94_length_26208_cov_6.281091_5_plen_283_part_00
MGNNCSYARNLLFYQTLGSTAIQLQPHYCWGSNVKKLHERERCHPQWHSGLNSKATIRSRSDTLAQEPEPEETDRLLPEQTDLSPLSSNAAYEDEPEWMWQRRTVDKDLERILNDEHKHQYGKENKSSWKCFDEWELRRGETFIDLFTSSKSSEYGTVKGLLRIVPQNENQTASMKKCDIGKVDPIQFRVSEDELTKSAATPVTVRLYVIRGLQLQSENYNGMPDSYLDVTLDGVDKITREDHICRENRNPYCACSSMIFGCRGFLFTILYWPWHFLDTLIT